MKNNMKSKKITVSITKPVERTVTVVIGARKLTLTQGEAERLQAGLYEILENDEEDWESMDEDDE